MADQANGPWRGGEAVSARITRYQALRDAGMSHAKATAEVDVSGRTAQRYRAAMMARREARAEVQQEVWRQRVAELQANDRAAEADAQLEIDL